MLAKTFYYATLTVTLLVVIVLSVLPTPSLHTDMSLRDSLKNASKITQASTTSLLIKNADIFNGQALLKNQDIEIKDGVIRNISRGLTVDNARIIDATGKTIVPGLIDALLVAGDCQIEVQASNLGQDHGGKLAGLLGMPTV